MILNACGTAAAGAVDFITAFNLRGVPTIIAAATTADAEMAGKFMNAVIGSFQAHGADYTIGQAVFDAHRLLRDEYGPKSLIFSVYGNPNARLCRSPAVRN